MRGAWLLFVVGCAAPPPAPETIRAVLPGLYLGAEPDEPVFRALASLGVKTLLSVDGAKPDVAGAARHGLRYVHLPIGYDGISPERRLELAKALSDLPGPIYLHCHHGKHRAPAAAAVGCVTAGKIDNARAVEILKTMGTGEQYLGLWAAAREAKPADLKSLRVEFREVAPVSSLAEAMVGLDHALENLGHAKKAGWAKPPDHPDVDPPHEALRARELLAELLRSDDLKGRPADYRGWMNAGLLAAMELERELRAKSAPATLDAVYERFRRTCADCHKPYRNAPKR